MTQRFQALPDLAALALALCDRIIHRPGDEAVVYGLASELRLLAERVMLDCSTAELAPAQKDDEI